ncbi:hypothetical protein TcasGA2_TC001664 [Tribolium castaneum]|uniref:Reverse transcriptase domain-containing protein n=1 Tax=Tribolium castaneum TaxID=7070 RepID=D6X1L4_TRICA|nr:hypothetical protein TcasGA2_TC001664 [Tribolium castaneum]
MTSFNPLNFHRPSWIETHPFYLLAASNPVVDEKICPINNSVTDGLNVFDNDMVVTQQMHKRQLSEDNDEDNPLNLSLSSMFETDSGTSQGENIRDFKRQKTNSMESVLSDVSNLLSPAKDLLDNCESYPLSFSQMVDFFNRSSREHDIAVLVQTFTSDISGLLDQLYDMFPLLLDKSIKNRCDMQWPASYFESPNCTSQLFSNFFINSNLSQLIDKPTRFRQHQRPSILDWIITSDEHLVNNVSYESPIGKSDHAVLTADLQICHQLCTKVIPITKSVTNFDLVSYELQSINWESLFCNKSVEASWKAFKSALDISISKHSVTFSFKKSSTNPWVNARILKMIREKRRVWKIYKRSGKQSDYSVHRSFSNNLRETIREARRKYENSLAASKDPKLFYKYVRSKTSASVIVPKLKHLDGSLIDDDHVVADEFAKSFLHNYSDETMSNFPSFSFANVSPLLSDVVFSKEIVIDKILKLRDHVSPGSDGITARLLKQCCHCLSGPLAQLMTLSLQTGTLPSDWKLAVVKPIYKKGDKFNPSSYRPVSLTSLVIKIMESIVCDRLRQHLLTYNIIPPQQHGFIKGRCITTNMLACFNEWSRAFDNGENVDVIYFDFSKAFDRLPRKRLLLKLQHYGIGGNLLQWIDSFLSYRFFTVKIGNASSMPMSVRSGVPQGSVLGPLLFITYCADLSRVITSPWSSYADDIKIYSGDSLALSHDINAIYSWSRTWLMPLNFDKCVVLHIGRKNPQYLYQLHGSTLVKVKSHVDLGLEISSDLSWTRHINRVVKKANTATFIFRKAFQGTQAAAVIKLYKAFIRPMLEFGNAVWHPTLVRDSNLLESVQRRITRIPFGRIRPCYPERLKVLHLTTLEDRRVRGDLITTFKALTDADPSIRNLFVLHGQDRTRGHQLKLRGESFKTTARQYFLPLRVFHKWNSLPDKLLDCTSVLQFKINLDKYLNLL